MHMPALLKSREHQIKMINYPEWKWVIIYFPQTPISLRREQENVCLSEKKRQF